MIKFQIFTWIWYLALTVNITQSPRKRISIGRVSISWCVGICVYNYLELLDVRRHSLPWVAPPPRQSLVQEQRNQAEHKQSTMSLCAPFLSALNCRCAGTGCWSSCCLDCFMNWNLAWWLKWPLLLWVDFCQGILSQPWTVTRVCCLSLEVFQSLTCSCRSNFISQISGFGHTKQLVKAQSC